MDKNPFKNKQNNNKFHKNYDRKFKQSYKKPHGRAAFTQKATYRKSQYPISQIFRNKSLLEIEVGITEHLGKFERFNGIIKSRFTDFHVNEIDIEGNVLYLTDLTVPKAEVNRLSDEELQIIIEDTKDFITVENWNLIENMSVGQASNAGIRIDVTNLNKERRTTLHNTIRQKYEGRIISNTVDGQNDRKYMELKPNKKGNREKRRKKWAFSGGDHVHFLLHKENVDTTEITYMLSQSLLIKASNVDYCGNKDKRANTTQQCSVKQCEPADIVKAIIKIPHVKVGNFKIADHPLRLGYLKGNRFRIAIRYIDGTKSEMEKALEHLREYGCINYFGMQRFGNNAEVPTWEIGVALLQGDYKLATELILKPRLNDQPHMVNIRKKWWTERNSTEALAMFNRHNKCIEKKILSGLSFLGENDYCGALRQVPRNLLMLYPHALQSIIFNRIASRRIKEFGLKLLVGDLVFPPQSNAEEEIIDCIEGAELEAEEEEDEEGKVKKTETKSKKTQAIKVLTKEDIESGDFSIFDVLLTLPGYDVTYPANEVGNWYEEYLNLYKLKFEDFRNKNKTFEMSGTYRKLIIRPEDFSWQFCAFNRPDENLIASDVNKLFGNDITLYDEGKYRALIVNFNLPSSCYATMVLRELLKCDTSTTAQATMEKAILEKIEKENNATVYSVEKITNYLKLQRSMSESNICNVEHVNFLPSTQVNTTAIQKEPLQRKRSVSERKAKDDEIIQDSLIYNVKKNKVVVEEEEKEEDDENDNENMHIKKIKLDLN